MNNLKHLAIYDGLDVFFAKLEAFELIAVSGMPGRYLLEGFIDGRTIIDSVFCTAVKDLTEDRQYNLGAYVVRTTEA